MIFFPRVSALTAESGRVCNAFTVDVFKAGIDTVDKKLKEVDTQINSVTWSKDS